jgi:exosortase
MLLLLCYSQVLYRMGKDWAVDPNSSHGFIIPFISGYLVWKRKDLLTMAAVRPSGWGLPILLGGLLLLVVGKAGSELFTMRFSFVVVIYGLLIFLLGTDITKKLSFPISYLIFMIPIPYLFYDAVAFPLKLMAARISADMIMIMEIPIFREGNIIHLTDMTLQVADACSGIRSLTSLLALGTIFAYFTLDRVWERIVLVLLTVPIAVLANSFRVTGTAVLSHYYGSKVADGFFHSFSGWIIFVVAFMLLFLCGWVLSFIKKGVK